MESASDEQLQEPSVRPKRDHRLPQHLAPYDVTLLPSQQPEAPPSCTSVGQHGQAQSTRAKSLTSYRSPAPSRRSSRLSYGLHMLHSTSDIQAAELEEKIRGLELADLQQEIEEERKADLETAVLDAQARERQRLQEEAHIAKEKMAREMGRRRRLKKLEKEVHIATLVKSYLSDVGDDASSTTSASATSSKLQPPPNPTQQPPSLLIDLQQLPPAKQSTPAPSQVPPPSTVFTAQALAPPANPVTSVLPRVPVIAAPTAVPVSAPVSPYLPIPPPTLGPLC